MRRLFEFSLRERIYMIYWLLLIVAIVFEVMGTTCMKLSEGFSKIGPSIMLFVFYAISFCLLVLALKKIDVSVAYAIWAGLGTAVIAVIGFIWFKEPVSVLKIASIGLIIAGVVMLEMAGH